MQLDASVITYKSLEFITVSVSSDFSVPVSDDFFNFEDALLAFAIKHGQEDDGSWWVAVGFRNSNKNAATKCPYLIDMHAIGRFTLHEALLEDHVKNKMIFETGGAIVYGAIRDMVSSITSRGARGKIMLPTPTFLGAYQKHLEELAVKANKKMKKPKKLES